MNDLLCPTIFLSALLFYVAASQNYRKRKRNAFFKWAEESWLKRKTDSGFDALVGNTPLVRIASLSDELDCEVYGKAEFLNPGGSVKDRVAKFALSLAETRNQLKRGWTVYEGTSGSTGISLALAAKCQGYNCTVYMPDDQAEEKTLVLKTLGAKVIHCPAVSIASPDHYCNMARMAAKKDETGFFVDQFESVANFLAHFFGTGAEIISEARQVDAFVCSSGTGGTLAGCAARLKLANPSTKVFLADPQGSALHGVINDGVLFTDEDSETQRKRIFSDTIVEGVGNNRLTSNFKMCSNTVDGAVVIPDDEVVKMSRQLIEKDGLFLGSSSALNCCAVQHLVRSGMIQRGSRVVTILRDTGLRHLSRFYNVNSPSMIK